MAGSKMNVGDLNLIGSASCLGGEHPDPTLHRFPLLGWQPDHYLFGDQVFTEDGMATVQQIAITACETPNYCIVAERFGTTAEHVSQAIEYAVCAGFLG